MRDDGLQKFYIGLLNVEFLTRTGIPGPGWMIENDEDGDLLHIGARTIDSKRPPPSAMAREKQSMIKEDSAMTVLMRPLPGGGPLLQSNAGNGAMHRPPPDPRYHVRRDHRALQIAEN